MRKICFDEKTINEIRNYINEGHTKKEVCNRFTIKIDTLDRVMRENRIEPFYKKVQENSKVLSQETINLVCNLFECTDTRLQDIKKQSKIKYWEMQQILQDNFSEEFINNRKAKLYRNSKLAEKNPMAGMYKEKHPKYKGIIGDGQGYLMCLKPDWYEGRKKSDYVFLHHIVMCEYLHITKIPERFVVHHIDGNKQNNDISNLALMEMGAHTRLHQLQNKLCKVQRLSENGVGVKSEMPDNNRNCE